MGKALLLSLVLTLAIEGVFAVLMKKRGWDLLLCMLVNVVTNPVAVLLSVLLPGPLTVALCEGGAVAAEGTLYRFCGETYRRPFLFSLCANAISFGTGLLLQAIWYLL